MSISQLLRGPVCVFKSLIRVLFRVCHVEKLLKHVMFYIDVRDVVAQLVCFALFGSMPKRLIPILFRVLGVFTFEFYFSVKQHWYLSFVCLGHGAGRSLQRVYKCQIPVAVREC